MAALAATAAPPAITSALELRTSLEMLLGEHVRLTVQLMRDRIAGADPRTSATADAVGRNADELTAAVRALYGDAAGSSFSLVWNAHVKELQDYAAALSAHDDAARQQVRQRLLVTEGDIGDLFTSATGGALPRDAAHEAIRMHVDTLLQQADSWAAADYAGGYTTGRECFSHMIGTADALATAMATSKGFPVEELQVPRRRLQSALSRLLAEHIGLAGEAMRAASDAAPDLTAGEATLNANTADLGAAVQALYGDAAGQQFLQVWAPHVEALVTYAGAERSGDQQKREAARQQLAAAVSQLADFLAGATSGRLSAGTLTNLVTQYDAELTGATDAVAAKDFKRAQEVSAAGYRHMFELAQTFADAVGDAVASRLPSGGAQTGGGGLAPPS